MKYNTLYYYDPNITETFWIGKKIKEAKYDHASNKIIYGKLSGVVDGVSYVPAFTGSTVSVILENEDRLSQLDIMTEETENELNNHIIPLLNELPSLSRSFNYGNIYFRELPKELIGTKWRFNYLLNKDCNVYRVGEIINVNMFDVIMKHEYEVNNTNSQPIYRSFDSHSKVPYINLIGRKK